MKKRSLIVLLTVGVLALASIGGALIVNAGGEHGKDAKDAIQERAAEIIGVESSDLKDALAQAYQEAVDAKIDAFIDSAVTDGDITESEAGEIRTWLADQPELSGMDGRNGKFGLSWLYSGGDSKAGAILDKLVENDIITEDELTAYTAWLDERPAAVDQLLPTFDGKGDRGARFGRGHFGGHGHGKSGYDCGSENDGDSSQSETAGEVTEST